MKLALQATIYHLWLERNARAFTNVTKDCSDVLAAIKFDLKCRILGLPKLAAACFGTPWGAALGFSGSLCHNGHVAPPLCPTWELRWRYLSDPPYQGYYLQVMMNLFWTWFYWPVSSVGSWVFLNSKLLLPLHEQWSLKLDGPFWGCVGVLLWPL